MDDGHVFSPSQPTLFLLLAGGGLRAGAGKRRDVRRGLRLLFLRFALLAATALLLVGHGRTPELSCLRAYHRLFARGWKTPCSVRMTLTFGVCYEHEGRKAGGFDVQVLLRSSHLCAGLAH